MAFGALTDAFSILASEETFVDKDLLYVAGGLLVLLALGISFMGIRSEDFPTSTQLRVVVGLCGALVVFTAFGAVQTARFEQAERRAENQEAASEAGAEEVENEESLSEGAAGEAGDPESGTGATPDSGTEATPGGEVEGGEGGEGPQSSTGGAGSGTSATAAADLDAGRTLFTDTGCGGCHALADADSAGDVGPDLDESVSAMSPDDVRTAIVDPGAEVAEGFPDGTMPTNYGEELDEAQIDTLVAYLVAVTKG